MTLKEQIVEEKLAASKSGNTVQRNLLSVFLTELEKLEKLDIKIRPKGDVTDEEVMLVAKKLADSNTLCKNEAENVYLEKYLPKLLSETELKEIIAIEINTHGYSIKDFGKIMSYLSTYYSKQYDGKVASDLIKSKLS